MLGDETDVEAIGTFDVTFTPIGSRERRFRGLFAMERGTAALGCREASFALRHSGLADTGAQSLTVVVVPNPATDGLTETRNVVVTPGPHGHRFR